MSRFIARHLREFPAKTYHREDGSATLGIGILQHGCLAGLVLKNLLELVRIPGKSELLPSSLPTLAALHDIGKANPFFLRKLLLNCGDAERWQELASDALPDVEETSHPIVSAAVLKQLGAPQYCCQLVAEHHGVPLGVRIPSGAAEYLGGEPWENFRELLADEILKLAGLEGFPVRLKDRRRKTVQADLWLGWVILADWIASRRNEPVQEGEESRIASELVSEAGFRPLPLQSGKSFEQTFGFAPRRAQSMLTDAYVGPGVYVLEAPTGCGKTEAALGLAFRVLNEGDASGIYFALPTQLTSNRAHERVQDAVGRYLGESADVRLTHGGAHVRMGKEAAPGGIWYTSSRLALLAPLGVGTVDQALLAVLSTKFKQVRLAGLCGKVVILDEIHSYDAYTLELIARLVRALEAMGSTVIILSATLTHAGLKKILGDEEVPESKGVVSLTVKTGEGIRKLDDGEATAHPVTVRLLEQAAAEEDALAEALDRVRAGMQVLWIENSVRAAQRIHERCLREGVASGLLHSRFRSVDREVNEEVWTGIFGKAGKAKRSEKGRILVGTQVLEQSLDLDADFMVTRVAPLDLLVQRFGRLWRHAGTERPAGCTCAEALVLAVPEEPGVSSGLDDGVEQPFGVTGRIYHPYHLMRTIETLKSRLAQGAVLNLPREVRGLLTAVFNEREETCETGLTFKRHLLAQEKRLEDGAQGALSITHEQPEEAATRLVEQPFWEHVVLFEEDVKALAACTKPEEAALLLESRLVKSALRLAPAGMEGLADRFPAGLRSWALRARRFKNLTVCLCSEDGKLTKSDGSPVDRPAVYSKTLGLVISG